MIFISFFVSFIYSADVYPFNIDQSCICAVNRTICNPYCCCDPQCSVEAREKFSFCLPERLGQAKISCDQSGRLEKQNINQIISFEIEGVKCYAIDDPTAGSTITNFDPADFGLNSFSQITPNAFNSTTPDFNRSYEAGDYLLVKYSESDYSAKTYLPVSVGSAVCNAMIPIKYGVSYPNQACRVPFENNSPPFISIQPAIFFRNIVEQSDKPDILFKTDDGSNVGESFFYHQTYVNQTILNMQFLFQSNSTGGISYYKPRRENDVSKATIPGKSKTNLMIFGHQVFFSDEVVDTTGLQKYQIGNMGYYYGVPIMVSPLNINLFYFEQRQPLRINNDDVLFGVDSSYVVKLTNLFLSSPSTNISDKCNKTDFTKNISNCTSYVLINNSNFNLSSFIEQVYPNAIITQFNTDTHTDIVRGNIFKVYGNVFDGVSPEVYSTNNTYITDVEGIKYPKAVWTFYYRKFNSKTTPIYAITRFMVYIAMPPNNTNFWNSNNTIAVIETKFIELDDKGNNYFKPTEKAFYRGRLSMVFDVFFIQDSDALKSIGILFCFALLGTIWCWYMCFFHIE